MKNEIFHIDILWSNGKNVWKDRSKMRCNYHNAYWNLRFFASLAQRSISTRRKLLTCRQNNDNFLYNLCKHLYIYFFWLGHTHCNGYGALLVSKNECVLNYSIIVVCLYVVLYTKLSNDLSYIHLVYMA